MIEKLYMPADMMDRLNLTKAAVYYRLDTLGLEPVKQYGNAKLYDQSAFDAVANFKPKTPGPKPKGERKANT